MFCIKIIFSERLEIEKWRRDEGKIRELIDLGFAIVIPEEQKFYLPSELAARAMTLDHALKEKNKIAIFRGSYEHQGAVVFDESKEIVAEPGTEMIVCLRHRWQTIFCMNDWQDGARPTVQISNLTITVSWPTLSIYKQLLSHIKRRLQRITYEPQLYHPENASLFHFANVSVRAPSSAYLFQAVTYSSLSVAIVWAIMRLTRKKRVTPVQVVFSLLSTGLLSGYSLGNYITSSCYRLYSS